MVTALQCQQFAAGPVDRNAVTRRAHALKPEPPVGVSLKHGAQIHVVLLRVLVLVQSAWRRLPGLHTSSGNRLAVGGDDLAAHEQGRAAGLLGCDVRAIGKQGLVGTPEWTNQRRLGTSGSQDGLGVQQEHMGCQAKNVGQQNALVLFWAGGLAYPDQEIQPLVQLVIGQLDLGCEGMDVPYQGVEDFARTSILRALVGLQHGLQKGLGVGRNGLLLLLLRSVRLLAFYCGDRHMSPWILEVLVSRSVGVDIGRGSHLGPTGDFFGDSASQLRWSASNGSEAHFVQTLGD